MRPWWKDAIIYQIYPRSFMDYNNDGNGDLLGIISKLDYLADLGVDAIWISPIYSSPMHDNGYDVSNYYEINPMYGTMEDFDNLVLEAKKRNIKIIMDLVCNHTSTEHPWFKEAIKNPNSKYHDFYFFQDKPDDKRSSFGGSAWCYVPEINQYYYHYFDESQADLNWSNPLVRMEVAKIVSFWLDKGCGGFRLDAIELIGKELDKNIICNGPRIHEYLHDLFVNSFKKYEGAMSVGEGWPTVEIALDYTKEEKEELNMIFQFETPTLDWNSKFSGKYEPIVVDKLKLKESIERWQHGLDKEGWNALFLENHDLGRSVSRYGDDENYLNESAKMLATMMMLQKGTVFLYQGEEMGFTNPKFDKLELYNDVDTLTKYKELVLDLKMLSHDEFMIGALQNSRDNARTPMQWSNGVNAGFNKGCKPWLSVNQNYVKINYDAQKDDENSVLNYYKELIQLRKKELKEIILEGSFERLKSVEINDSLLIYKRSLKSKSIYTIINLGKENINFNVKEKFNVKKLFISNYKEIKEYLRPYESIVFEGEENE